MIKKSVFEEELVAGMHRELVKKATSHDTDGVEKAVDYLNSAIDILEDAGMMARADQVLKILTKIAKEHKDPRKVSDRHTKGLTPDKMVNNLKHHGTVFNMSDDGQAADDLLNLDIDDKKLEISEQNLQPEVEDFEDERD
jgi:hypothetical protein